MISKWILKNGGISVKKMSQVLKIDEILCRILINRGVRDKVSAITYLNPDLSKLKNPRLLKDSLKAVEILKNKINENKKIRIIGDYDVDGVISTYILYSSLRKCGANVDYEIPHRIKDGYGININIIKEAKEDGVDTIITCDNGIAAVSQIEYAKSNGMTVIITDHHEVPFAEEEEGIRNYIVPPADAVIDQKQSDCEYPYKNLCGAGVAFKLMQLLFEEMNFDESEAFKLIEFVAIAAVCDVVDLDDENRIFVKEGLKRINSTSNIGLKALIEQTGISNKNINVYHLGFIIGPCINASGRLDCAKRGLELLLCEDESKAQELALELYELNNQRKEMTFTGVDEVIDIIESTDIKKHRVMVVYKKNIHESISGIIAGKVREKYNVPVIILTDGEDYVKGSGRSIEEYNMFEELLKCKDLFIKFGGHAMAAGLSIKAENVKELRKRLNEQATLTAEDLIPKVYIDGELPIGEATYELAMKLSSLEPFGKGNPKPLFGSKNVTILRAYIIGNNKNVLRFKLDGENGIRTDAIYFGDVQEFQNSLISKYGQEELNNLLNGQKCNIKIDIIYSLEINEYGGTKTNQLVIKDYRVS